MGNAVRWSTSQKIEEIFYSHTKHKPQIFLHFCYEVEISKFFYSDLKTKTFKNFMFYGPTWTADQPGPLNKKFVKRIYSHAKADKNM